MNRLLTGAVACFAFAMMLVAAALAAKPETQTGRDGLAVRGFDVVAYFEEGKPVEGKPEFTATWNGATWHFASAAHRDAFLAEPQRYAPQYGGYCAYAVAKNTTAEGKPQFWKIVDGKLYLNYSQSVQNTWNKDIPGYIAKAEKNWPGVLGR